MSDKRLHAEPSRPPHPGYDAHHSELSEHVEACIHLSLVHGEQSATRHGFCDGAEALCGSHFSVSDSDPNTSRGVNSISSTISSTHNAALDEDGYNSSAENSPPRSFLSQADLSRPNVSVLAVGDGSTHSAEARGCARGGGPQLRRALASAQNEKTLISNPTVGVRDMGRHRHPLVLTPTSLVENAFGRGGPFEDATAALPTVIRRHPTAQSLGRMPRQDTKRHEAGGEPKPHCSRSNPFVSGSGWSSSPHETPPMIDLYSSSSVGGHHFSMNVGRFFMKQSCSSREESFYQMVSAAQQELVGQCLRKWIADAIPANAEDIRLYADHAAAQAQVLLTDDSHPILLQLNPEKGIASSVPTTLSTGSLDLIQEVFSSWWEQSFEDSEHIFDTASYEVHCRAHSGASPLRDHCRSVGPPPGMTEECRRLEERTRALQLLAPFVPLFHGVRGVAWSTPMTTEESGAFPTDADKPDDNPLQFQCRMIVLEDVCFGFAKPCVLDVKMGSRQYGLHATAEKRRSKELKSHLSTSGRYGIRLAGYRRWCDATQQFVSRSKLHCRGLSLEEVREELLAFLSSCTCNSAAHHSSSASSDTVSRGEVEDMPTFTPIEGIGSNAQQTPAECEEAARRVGAIKARLVKLLQRLLVAFETQTVFRFFTSSLLIVYDAARPLETIRVVMVDFAYTYEWRELVQSGDPDAECEYDVGYILALRSLIGLFSAD